MKRKIVFAIMLACSSDATAQQGTTQPPIQPEPSPKRADILSTAGYVEDFEAAWAFVHDNYAYFDHKQTDWDRVRALSRERVAGVQSRKDL